MSGSIRPTWRLGLRRPFSVRVYVIGLILVAVLPLLAFSGFLVIRSASHEQAILADTVQASAAGFARDIERELGSLRGRLFTLASAEALQPGNLPALRARVGALLGPAATLVISAPDGTELLDTRVPPGARLPDNPDAPSVRRVAETGQPYVSDLSFGPLSHAASVMMSIPIMQGGKVVYVASLDVMASVDAMLRNRQLPADWIATVSDRGGVTIARTRAADQFVGQPARPGFLRRIQQSDEGWFPAASREGIPLYVAFSHIKPVGWAVVVGIPTAALYAPVRLSTRILLLDGVAIVGLALVLAVLLGRRIAGPIAGLAKYAERVGREELVAMRPTSLRETDAVARSLHQASDHLHRTRAERAQAAAALATSEERKQVLQQAVLVQEAERTRIARELHDSLGQYLTALQLGLNMIGRYCLGQGEAMYELARLRDLTSRAGREINRMAWELRPTALDDLGLEKATTQYLEEWAERSEMQFDVQVDLGTRRLPQTVETTVYRALQEAVTNVVRHAEAGRVGVVLRATEKQVQLIVEDDGKGFAFDDTAGDDPGGRLGLRGIRERLALVEGTLDVESIPQHGTTLFVRVPL